MIVAVIPLKRLREAKRRLAPYLSRTERANLMLDLAGRAVQALRSSAVADRIAVVSAEPDVALRCGVDYVHDPGDLNAAVRAAVGWARNLGATGLLVLPGDLPRIQADDVRAMVDACSPSVAVAPTHDGGTGALFLAPPDVMLPSFGPGSAARHLREARRRGIDVREVQRPGLAFDLDTGDDLARLAGR
jgi:2-phospho-L-lactate guanylyltransferase